MTRICEICKENIEHRQPHAKYCKKCYRVLNRERTRRRWETGIGTTAFGSHTKIRVVKGKHVNIEKERRIIDGEIKRLGLRRYITKQRKYKV